jgi:hypothetical protein
MVTCFLTEYKRGVCRHFAAAATMMFRALGIPARYAIGFKVDVNANEWRIYGDEIGEEGHAWTEVYLEDYGWVAIEVTGGIIDEGENPGEGSGDNSNDWSDSDSSGDAENGSNDGSGGGSSGNTENGSDNDFDDSSDGAFEENKYNVTVKTPSVQKVYDGKPLKGTDLQLSLPQGVKAVVVSSTELTDVGSTENVIKIKLIDLDGKDCTGKITYEYGELTIVPKEITFTTGSKMASGVSSLSCEEYSVEGLVNGDYVVVSELEFACQEGPGTCSNTIQYTSLVIKNAKGEDVTKNYIIQMNFGVLVLTP